jgi:3-(3-hydroxy-phenyl)propionate hydroxylase
MHQPNLEKRASVFYDYKIHPFSTPPEMTNPEARHKVLIVGAGPVGLTTALLLAKSGVPSVVIESEAQVSHGSRAVAATRRSMEVLQQAGASEPFVKNGLVWNFGRSFYRGTEVFRMEIPTDVNDRFAPVTNNPQQYWEEYLVDCAEKSDLIDLRWQTKYVCLEENSDVVRARLDTPEGEYTLSADWLVACDGGRSVVRKELGLRMEGAAYGGKFVIVDIKAPDFDFATERRCYFDPEWNPGNSILLHRQPYDLWRLDYRLPEGETEETALEPALLASRVNDLMAMVGKVVDWELDWASVYSANTKTLPEYRQGRVLLAGDAAHLLPIFGIRGANTGFQDAENLAWKLAMVVTGDAGIDLIDTYSTERVKAAREICDEAAKSTRMMDPPTKGYELLRSAILSFSLSDPFCAELMHWRTSRPHVYLDSRLNAADDDNASISGGIVNGAVARNVKLGTDDFLFDHFRFGYHLLIFGGGDRAVDANKLANRDRVRVISVNGGATNADVDISSAASSFATIYGLTQGGMYLLRPDMHVCGRWTSHDLDKVDTVLEAHSCLEATK